MVTLDVVVRGTKPLLMHSPAALLKPKNRKIKSTDHNPEEEAKESLYLNDEGKICVPSLAVLSCLRKAAVNLKKPGSGKKTLKDYVYSGLSIEPDMIPLDNQIYEIDIRPVTVQRVRIMRARPIFKNWSLQFKITIQDPSTWDNGIVRSVLEDAGKYQGLLDFRPLFGTFKVERLTDENGKEIK